MLESLVNYAKGMSANDEVIFWVTSVGKSALVKRKVLLSELEHIIDYLVSGAAPTRLRKLNYIDAKRKADDWTKANQKKGRHLKDQNEDTEMIHDFLDGTSIVRLKTKQAFQREGFLMNHCVGGYSAEDKNCLIYSYRDSKNIPHATFEVRKSDGVINQIKGKGNGPIHPKYIHPILAFLKSIGMEIRPNDMQNLGYYHLAKDHLEYLKQSDCAWAQVTMINGEAYASENL
jgi:hypothetical protein